MGCDHPAATKNLHDCSRLTGCEFDQHYIDRNPSQKWLLVPMASAFAPWCNSCPDARLFLHAY
jgi:hypothetical protein